MARVKFTQNLRKHLDTPTAEVDAGSVRDALHQVFSSYPVLRGYVLDDQGRLRKHVVLFVDGEMVRDRERLSDPLGPASELLVMQALSGG